jgi:hypothetical protein
MSSHNKGLAHQNNVYNSEPIFQKEDVIITRKNFSALETKEQWLSDSVRYNLITIIVIFILSNFFSDYLRLLESSAIKINYRYQL